MKARVKQTAKIESTHKLAKYSFDERYKLFRLFELLAQIDQRLKKNEKSN